jgi:hypothetical protein
MGSGNPKVEADIEIVLEKDGKRGILFRSRRCTQSMSDFLLEEKNTGGHNLFFFQDLEKKGRGYGIRQIADDFSRLSLQDILELDPESIFFENGEIGIFLFFEVRGQGFIFFESDNFRLGSDQQPRQSSLSCPYLDDNVPRHWIDDLYYPAQGISVLQKVLAEDFSFDFVHVSGKKIPKRRLNYTKMASRGEAKNHP